MFRAIFTGIVLPIQVFSNFVKKVSKIKVPAWVWAFTHIIVLALAVGVSVYLWNRFGGYQNINASPALKFAFPGIVILLSYAAFRLVIYLIRQIPATEAEFPDIEHAVDEGVAALAAANLSVRDLPLFVVVGLSPQDERSFVESTLVGNDVRVAEPNDPIHWYADHRAIWVTIPGASAICAQAKLAASPRPLAVAEALSDDPSGSIGDEANRFQTISGGAARFETIGAAAVVASEASTAEGYIAPTKRLDADERDRLEARLRYFVRLLKDARYPVCSANGILLTVPYAWSTSPGLSQLSDTVKLDMHTLQETLGVKCLCITALTGIELFPEFKTYMERLDRDQLERRCGCSFPSLITPNSDDIEKTHNWIVQYFERQVFELFQRKLGDTTNGNLFRLLDRIRKARPNLIRIFKSAFPDDVREPSYAGGVYFASLEALGKVRLPFFEGLLARLLKEHDEVIGWSDASLQEDRRMQNLSRGLWLFAGALVILDALAVLLLFRSAM
jgi:hypothetical protein